MCRNCVHSVDGKRTIFLPDQDQPGVVIEALSLGETSFLDFAQKHDEPVSAEGWFPPRLVFDMDWIYAGLGITRTKLEGRP